MIFFIKLNGHPGTRKQLLLDFPLHCQNHILLDQPVTLDVNAQKIPALCGSDLLYLHLLKQILTECIQFQSRKDFRKFLCHLSSLLFPALLPACILPGRMETPLPSTASHRSSEEAPPSARPKAVPPAPSLQFHPF